MRVRATLLSIADAQLRPFMIARVALLTVSVLAIGCAGPRLAAGFRLAHPECREHVDHWGRAGMPGVVDAEACGIRDVGVEVPATPRWNFGGEAVRRASFELSCPVEQLQFVLIDRDHGGVEGCGRRLVYMSTRNGWILNSLLNPVLLENPPPPPRQWTPPLSSPPGSIRPNYGGSPAY